MKFINSFKHAFRGFIYCLISERNMRIHTVISLYVLFFAYFFSLTKNEISLLLLTISSVITAETFNTSIEKLADFCSYEYNQIIRVVKDISAGAVVFCASISVIIGLIIFFDFSKLSKIINLVLTRVDIMIYLFLSLIISIIYISKGPLALKNFILNFKKTKEEKKIDTRDR